MSPARSEAVVVVGGGLAAARTCQELRAAGFTGINCGGLAPYDRPPLSKPTSETGSDEVAVELGVDWAKLDVDIRLDTPAVALQAATDGPLIATAGGDRYEAAAVIVATGADPLLPDGWLTGDEAALRGSVLTLRTFDDRRLLDARLADPAVAAVTVAGGSWLGMEIATLARPWVDSVQLVEQAAWLLPLLPPEVGRAVGDWLPPDTADLGWRRWPTVATGWRCGGGVADTSGGGGVRRRRLAGRQRCRLSPLAGQKAKPAASVPGGVCGG
jgi:hypothetical protein